MANSFSGNVIFVDTSASFPYAKNIESVKYVGAASSSATIKGNADSSGPTLWTDNSSSTTTYETCIRDCQGVYVAITGTAAVYIHLK